MSPPVDGLRGVGSAGAEGMIDADAASAGLGITIT